MEKGKLKIFFGYSAGVGKTYAMLQAAHELKAQGVDVVIGYIEPHTRPETMNLTSGLEIVTLREIEYKGLKVKEFDVDGALLRKPELILVDELAHTNVIPSKHKKRYQDIQELLNNGINVFTTVNVQHLEGLNDVIDSATSVKVGETIPDEIFDKADEVELIDLEPSELVERLRLGKVYKGEHIIAALEHFFTVEHLSNLREVAMRRGADRIVKQSYATEVLPKILVLVSPSPSSSKNIRIASKMADSYHCKFCAMYVERNGELDVESAKNIKSHIKLVQDLSGEMIIKYSDSLIETIATFVKVNGITNIIIGKSWRSIYKNIGLENQIIQALPMAEVLIVPDNQSDDYKKKFHFHFGHYERLYVFSFLVYFLVGTLIGFVSFVASLIILSIGFLSLFIFFLLVYSKKINIGSYYKQANRTLDSINGLIMNSKAEHGTLHNIAKILSATFMRSVIITYKGETKLRQFENVETDFFNTETEIAIRNWCLINCKNAGKGTDTLRNSKAIYFALTVENGKVACIGFSCINSKLSVTDRMLFLQLMPTIILLLQKN